VTPWGWVMLSCLGAAVLLAAVGFIAFWPPSPPIEPAKPRPRPPLRVTEDPWVDILLDTDEARAVRARHRAEDHGQDTIPLRWYDRPGTGEQPLYPGQ
jgi:hypothetical protein